MPMIVLDLDDSLFETEKAMTHWINHTLGVPLVWKNRLSRTDPNEAPYLEKVLENGEFMKHAEWRPGYEQVPALITDVRSFNPNVNFMFCTHRGYHPNAPEFTKYQFERLGLELEGVFLDYDAYPCKKAYLDELLGNDYYLFDDNPHWGGSKEEKVERIYLMDQIWNQSETAYERIFTFEQFSQKLFDIAFTDLHR